MRRGSLFSVGFMVLLLAASSSLAQDRPLVGTVIDVDEGRRRLQIEVDTQYGSRVTIESDSVSTTWHGFGTVINDRPEIFTGSSGLANVRLGDRIQVVGSGQSEGTVRARQVTLLGRSVDAPQVGVGQTRTPTSASTPTTTSPAVAPAAGNVIEGTIRQINDEEGRLVIQTTDRRMVTVRTFRNTPVYYQAQVYRVTNLELGDRIRVEADPRDTQGAEITARRIDVTQSVQEAGMVTPGGTVTLLEGRVTRVEPQLGVVYLEQPRGEVMVDMTQAANAENEVLQAADLSVGDFVEISGSYNRVGDLFLASTVRYPGGGGMAGSEPFIRYSVVTLTGTIVETLDDGPTIGFRESETNSIVRIWVTQGFAARTRGTAYINADALRVNDTAVIDVFRDGSGNLIAQAIRLRNR
ncbi:MAG TPA: hypothetical protein VF701_22440 [Thermoanaerobaculia bacterium]